MGHFTLVSGFNGSLASWLTLVCWVISFMVDAALGQYAVGVHTAGAL